MLFLRPHSPRDGEHICAVLLPERLQRAQLLFDRLVRCRVKAELGISPAQPRKDAVIHLDLHHHHTAELRRLRGIGRNHACREPCKLIGTHAQRAGGIDGGSVPVQLGKGGKVQPDQPDDEYEEGNKCDS